MTVELSTIVDLFLMSFPIMQAIITIRSYPREPAVEQACAVRLLLSAAASGTLGVHCETRGSS